MIHTQKEKNIFIHKNEKTKWKDYNNPFRHTVADKSRNQNNKAVIQTIITSLYDAEVIDFNLS